MRDLSAAEEARVIELLGSLRTLDCDVDVSGRVMASVMGFPRDAEILPSLRQIGWVLAGAVATCVAGLYGLTSTLDSAPPGVLDASTHAARGLWRLLDPALARRIAGPIARAALETTDALSRSIPGGDLPFATFTGASALCLAAMTALTAVLLFRDLARAGAAPSAPPRRR